MITLRVEAGYRGPTLGEMASLISHGSSPVEARWLGTRPEIELVRKLRRRRITLVVEDIDSMQRAAGAVESELHFEPEFLKAGAGALSGHDAGTWKSFVQRHGTGVARGVMVSTAAQIVRQHLGMQAWRDVSQTCLFEGVSPMDADTLLGLRARLTRIAE